MPNEGPTEHQSHCAAHIQAPKDGCDCPRALLPAGEFVADWILPLADTVKKAVQQDGAGDGEHLQNPAQLLRFNIRQLLLNCCALQSD